MKHNPGFLTEDELVASFCVRSGELESILEMLRECDGRSNPHRIVLGPRGCGKTSLLLRVAAEIRRTPDLSSSFFPVIFAEESYEVATAGEFWLEALSRLATAVPRTKGGDNLARTFGELRSQRDDRMLRLRCLGALLDFADRENRRLILMVENLNMMFRDMADQDAGWQLRETLQTEPRIVMLASATSRFDEIDNPDRAFYDLFTHQTLRPLKMEECAILWERVAGQRRSPKTIGALRILTGGSPRLLTIVARFGAGLSFRELMDDLLNLVDDHTEYFRSHIEALPAQERRVYLALADLWEPASAREVAERARLDTNKCSAQLKRLIDRGVVEIAGGSPRRKLYYLSERLYNIYYLMRRSREPDRMVKALIRFMAAYYSPSRLRDLGVGIQKAEITWTEGNYSQTIEATNWLLERRDKDSSKQSCQALLIRARARLAIGDLPAAEQDLMEALAILPEFDALLGDGVEVLMAFCVELGPARSLDLISTSLSAPLLVPLTTALERELGKAPRVAREVEEIAEDIRRDLKQRRRRGNDGMHRELTT